MSVNESKEGSEGFRDSNGKLKLTGLKLSGPPAKRFKTVSSAVASHNDDDDEHMHQEVKKEYVLAVENAQMSVLNPQKEEELVIPLVKPVVSNEALMRNIASVKSLKGKSTTTITSETTPNIPAASSTITKESLDEIAAKEILKDLLNPNRDAQVDSKDDDLTILPSQSTSANNVDASSKPLPLLLSGRVIDGANEDERYRNDFESRPEELDVKSEVYKAIPVEKFGAALLRGMGWSGPTPENEQNQNGSSTVNVRPARLGLGASDTWKKLAPLNEKKGNKLLTAADLTSSSTVAAAASSSSSNIAGGGRDGLSVGDIVKITLSSEIKIKTPVSHKRRPRGKVLATRGVPGLNRIRVLIEGSDEIVDIPVANTERVSRDELTDRPFEEHYHGLKNQEKEKERDKERDRDRDRDREREKDRDRGKDRDKRDSRDRDRDRDRKRDHSRDRDAKGQRDHREQSNKPSSSTTNASSNNLPQKWLRTGIRVKLVSKSYGENVYLRKGVVLDVPQVGFGSVRFDSNNILVNSIKEKHLETVLPKVGGSCMVLLGGNKGEIASLISKSSDQSKVTIQLVDSLEVLELDADWIAECDSSQVFY